MGENFFTWGNFITWVVCSIFIYLSLNFRLYMIFHHPGRKLKAKARESRRARLAAEGRSPQAKPAQPVPSAWGDECLHGPCYAKGHDFSDTQQNNHLRPH